MNNISIRKVLNFSKGSIEIKFNGTTSNNTNLDKIEVLLEDFIHNHRHNYMPENISIVRTILKDCKENSLVVFYQDERESEFVEYDNNNLLFYERRKKKIVNTIDIKLNILQLLV